MVRDYAEIPSGAERVIFFPAQPAAEAAVLLALLALAVVARCWPRPWRPRGLALLRARSGRSGRRPVRSAARATTLGASAAPSSAHASCCARA